MDGTITVICTVKLDTSKEKQNKQNKYLTNHYPAGIYLFKVNNGNARRMCEICLKLTVKKPEQRYGSHSGVFIVNF